MQVESAQNRLLRVTRARASRPPTLVRLLLASGYQVGKSGMLHYEDKGERYDARREKPGGVDWMKLLAPGQAPPTRALACTKHDDENCGPEDRADTLSPTAVARLLPPKTAHAAWMICLPIEETTQPHVPRPDAILQMFFLACQEPNAVECCRVNLATQTHTIYGQSGAVSAYM